MLISQWYAFHADIICAVPQGLPLGPFLFPPSNAANRPGIIKNNIEFYLKTS